jgi:hypothetical protein
MCPLCGHRNGAAANPRPCAHPLPLHRHRLRRPLHFSCPFAGSIPVFSPACISHTTTPGWDVLTVATLPLAAFGESSPPSVTAAALLAAPYPFECVLGGRFTIALGNKGLEEGCRGGRSSKYGLDVEGSASSYNVGLSSAATETYLVQYMPEYMAESLTFRFSIQ